jgi:hypothetical protein
VRHGENEVRLQALHKSINFSTFLRVSCVHSNTLLVALKLLPDSSGDGPDYPYPDLLETVLVHGEARHLLLHLPEQEEVCLSKACSIGWC